MSSLNKTATTDAMAELKELFDLFDIQGELTQNELRQAKKKVLLLHPDKNIGKDTSFYYDYFTKAYQKLETIYSFVKKIDKPSQVSTEYQDVGHDLSREGFYLYCEKEGLLEDPDKFKKVFNEMFEKVRIPDTDGYAEWFQSNEQVYDKNDLEKTRQQALQLVKKEDIKSYVEADTSDLKEVYSHTVFAIDGKKEYEEKKKFGSVEEYKQYRSREKLTPLTKEESSALLKEQQSYEEKQAMQLSYTLSKQTEKANQTFKEYCGKYLRIQ
jgi:hypothetical protein